MFRKLILVLLLLPLAGWAQYNNNYWVFGDSAGVDWSTNPPTTFKSQVNMWRGSASIGDNNGLVAYSILYNFVWPDNGKVWNRYQQEMQNGNYIYGGGWYHERLFLPVPGSDSLLYLISCCVTSSCPYGLYYTLIDLKANNDSGAVIQKNVPLNSYPAFDALMAVQHGNGRDWWVISQKWDGGSFNIPNNEFNLYLVTSNGIFLHSQQYVGSSHVTNAGHLCFNNSGDKFAVVSYMDLIQLYNFDRCTGSISLWKTLRSEYTSTPSGFLTMSCAFSPDDSKFYFIEKPLINDPPRLLQYNLNAPNIANSLDTVFVFSSYDQSVADLKLAPNGKIYVSAADEPLMTLLYPDTAYTMVNNNLSVINYPDSLAAACDFQPFSFNLGVGRTYLSLPNNPDYELGAWVGSPCDTLSVGVQHPEPTETVQPFLQAWYNHEWDMIHVNASRLQGKKGVLRLIDIEGRVVFEKQAEVISGGYFTTEIYTHDISDGVYVVNLVTDRETLSFKVGKY